MNTVQRYFKKSPDGKAHIWKYSLAYFLLAANIEFVRSYFFDGFI